MRRGLLGRLYHQHCTPRHWWGAVGGGSSAKLTMSLRQPLKVESWTVTKLGGVEMAPPLWVAYTPLNAQLRMLTRPPALLKTATAPPVFLDEAAEKVLEVASKRGVLAATHPPSCGDAGRGGPDGRAGISVHCAGTRVERGALAPAACEAGQADAGPSARHAGAAGSTRRVYPPALTRSARSPRRTAGPPTCPSRSPPPRSSR